MKVLAGKALRTSEVQKYNRLCSHASEKAQEINLNILWVKPSFKISTIEVLNTTDNLKLKYLVTDNSDTKYRLDFSPKNLFKFIN